MRESVSGDISIYSSLWPDGQRASRLVLARLVIVSPRPLIIARTSQRLKPFACSSPIVGGIESSCVAVTTSSKAGPSWAKSYAMAAGRLRGSSTRTAWIPMALAIAAKSGFRTSVP